MHFRVLVPLLNTTIKGVVWYQGEADAGHPGTECGGYNCTFPAMIADWRQKWNVATDGETDAVFPFGFVQLNSISNGSVYDNPTDPQNIYSSVFGYAGLRWAQTAGFGYVPNPKMPNVFMACSVDTPDRPTPFHAANGVFDPGFSVHSPYKQPTGSRLARAGLVTAYGMNIATVSAELTSVAREQNTIVLTLANVSSGVTLRTTIGFESLVQKDKTKPGVWVSVPIVGHAANTVTVGSVDNTSTLLRYNWYSNPCGKYPFQCAVYVSVAPLPNGLTGEEDFLPLPPLMIILPMN